MQIALKLYEELKKVGFAYAVTQQRKSAAEVGGAYVKKSNSIQGIHGYDVYECVI